MAASPAQARPDPGVDRADGHPADAGRADADPAYISLLFSRSAWQATGGSGCATVSPGARTLEQNAEDLRMRGLTATALVVLDRTRSQERMCFRDFMTQASWADLRNLRDNYGWSVVSQGKSYANMSQMTTDAQRFAESAGSLGALADEGFPRAWGAFAFANNVQNAAAQAVVADHFAFLRRYQSLPNTRARSTTAPYPMYTWSLNGGRCNNAALPCYTMKMANDRRSANVTTLQQFLNPAPGQWAVLQAYRLVEGRQGVIGDNYAWDCTSADWRDRWTSQPEISCRASYLEVVDGRSATAVVTDPTTIAEAWGRIPARYLGWPRP